MGRGMPSPRWRRRVRTLVLGLIACVALFWGAVDIVGVPVANLWLLLLEVVLGIALIVCLALLPALLLIWRRKRRHSLNPIQSGYSVESVESVESSERES